NMIHKLTDYIRGKYSAEEMFEVERDIDKSYVQIQQYLLKLGQRDLTSAQSIQEVKLLNILNDIEHIGDMVFHFIVKAEQIDEKNIVLSSKDQNQLDQLIEYIMTTYNKSIDSFLKNDMLMTHVKIYILSSQYIIDNDH